MNQLISSAIMQFYLELALQSFPENSCNAVKLARFGNITKRRGAKKKLDAE